MSDIFENRKLRNHDDPHHFSNWCEICGLYYCWHEVCKEHEKDVRCDNHKFTPHKKEILFNINNHNWDEE